MSSVIFDEEKETFISSSKELEHLAEAFNKRYKELKHQSSVTLPTGLSDEEVLRRYHKESEYYLDEQYKKILAIQSMEEGMDRIAHPWKYGKYDEGEWYTEVPILDWQDREAE